MPADSHTLDEEGVVIAPTKLVSEGELDRDLLAELTRRMRNPDQRRADLRAQLAAGRTGAARVEELVERHGLDTVREAMRETLDYAERRTRARIDELEDGVREASDVLEAADGDIELHLRAEVKGDELLLDFSGLGRSARRQPQLPAGRHAVGLLLRRAGAHRPGRAAVRGRLPAGEVIAPEGSLLNARPPHAVVAGNVETSSRVADLVLAAFGRALGQGTMNNLTLGNERFTYYETLGGGQGACPDADGPSAVHVAMSNTLNTPIEALELEFPLRAVEYAVRRGSGGAGAAPRRRRRGARARGARRDELLADHRAAPARATGRGRRRAGRAGPQPGERRGARAQGLRHAPGAATGCASRPRVGVGMGGRLGSKSPVGAVRGKLLLAGALAVSAFGVAPAAAVAQTSDLAKPHSSVEIVLDSSRAMGGRRLAAAKRAVVRAVRALPDGTPVGLRVYGGSVSSKRSAAACSDSQSVVPVRPADPAAMRSALRQLKPVGGRSPVSLALARAAKDMPPTGPRTIVLVGSDANDCAPAPDCQAVTGAPRPISVDAIGLDVDPAGRRDLQCTARHTGGIYVDAPDSRALEPELEAALGRATRDRRSLGRPLAGALEEQQATTARAGQYIDSIAPDTERWYHVSVPPRQRLTAVATLLAPPGSDVSAPGSSLSLQAFGAEPQAGKLAGNNATDAATNLFAFDPNQAITVSVTALPSQAGNSVQVALHDSPDKQLAHSLRGRSFGLELLFEPSSEAGPAPRGPATGPPAGQSSHDVSWAAAAGGLVACALIAFAALILGRRRAKSEEPA